MSDIEFDPVKNERNISSRGTPFELVALLDWRTATIWHDTRKNYGENRFFVLGYIDERLHALVYTVRENKIRVISLRKANKREERRYEQEKA